MSLNKPVREKEFTSYLFNNKLCESRRLLNLLRWLGPAWPAASAKSRARAWREGARASLLWEATFADCLAAQIAWKVASDRIWPRPNEKI